MKYTLRAAIAALSIGSIPPAMAGDGGSNPNTVLTEIPGVITQAPAPTEQRQSAQTDAGPAMADGCFRRSGITSTSGPASPSASTCHRHRGHNLHPVQQFLPIWRGRRDAVSRGYTITQTAAMRGTSPSYSSERRAM